MIEPINPSLWRSANRNTARAARRGSGLRLPTSQRFVGEPNREASTIAKRCVIVTPVRHSMPLTWNVASALGMEFERHDRSSRWQRRSSVPKLLKRPPRPYPCTKVTGAGFPWMLDAPRDGAKAIGQISGIIYIAWPPVVENGFLKAMAYDGKKGWL